MKRRGLVGIALRGIAGGGAASIVNAATLTELTELKALKASPRMPVLFVGHGSPMNAITENGYRASWIKLGEEFGKTLPAPQLILCVSAHWVTNGNWLITGMPQPKTIHDFGGFPQELFDQQYPAPGAPQVAKSIAAGFTETRVGIDEKDWGFDHGTWSVLKPMFPKAEIPVLQLSLDYSRPPSEHLAVGRQLRALRDKGVLIVGSGNLVHNLRAARRGSSSIQAYDWAIEFDKLTTELLQKGDFATLAGFQKAGQLAQLAHPTHEHLLPLIHATGAVDSKDTLRMFNTNFQSASISMRSAVWS